MTKMRPNPTSGIRPAQADSPNCYTPQRWIELLAEQFARELTAVQDIKRFTTNSALIGSHAEASVHRLIRRCVDPLRVSHGGIIYEGNSPYQVSQHDVIVWSPRPYPAILESGEFALVPRDSAIAFLEIKRTLYRGAAKAMTKTLSKWADLAPFCARPDTPSLTPISPGYKASLGIVCLKEASQSESSLQRLIVDKHAVILLREATNGDLHPNAEAIGTLVNFLAEVRLFAQLTDGQMRPIAPAPL